jgi:hypothetical protein
MNMATTKRGALTTVRKAQERLNKAETEANTLAEARNKALLAAKDAGATHPELQETTGLSQARIAQVLRRERATQ